MRFQRREHRQIVSKTAEPKPTTGELFVSSAGIHAPLHVGHSGDDTSLAAAVSIAPVVGHKRHAVLAYYKRRGHHGATTDEAEGDLGMKHQTCSARVNELAGLGYIEKTDERRPTSSGRSAAVYRITPVGEIELMAADARTNAAQAPRMD